MNSPSPEHAAHEHHHAMPHAADGPAKPRGRLRRRVTPVTVSLARMTGMKDMAWPFFEIGITLLLSIPTLLWSGSSARPFGGLRYIPAFFGTAVYPYGGSVFVKGGRGNCAIAWRDRLAGMMTLISLAITVAFVFSLAVTPGYHGEALWWELASLTTIVLWATGPGCGRSRRRPVSLRELARRLSSTAQRLVGRDNRRRRDLGASRRRPGPLAGPGPACRLTRYFDTSTP